MSDNTREITLTADDLEALASKLDRLELTDDEKTVMLAVFQVAGEALTESDDEVSGFNMQPGLSLRSFPGSLGGGFMDSFSSGVTRDVREKGQVSAEVSVKITGGGGK